MDEHLDTSWCPVCDRQILPKRYSVPIIPPQPILPTQPTTTAPTTTATNNAVKQSQTTRGKHGTIKARVQGGGLLHGTGRVRPGGGLRRDSGHNVPALQQIQHPTTTTNANANANAGKRLSPQKLAALQQQEQIRQLEAARQTQQAAIDLAAAQPRQRTVIDQAQTPLYCSDECMRQDLELSLSAATTQPIHTTRARLGMHPSQLNPSRASPPPPSPVLPPVPPNSYRTPGLRLSMSEESDADADSSSATGTSFSNSEASHGQSHSSPVEVGEWRREKEEEKEKDAQEGLMSVAARKLSTFFSTGNARQAREEATRRDRAALEARLRASPPNKPAEQQSSAVDELPNISTSHSDSNRPGLSNAQRAQSAIELYSKYPLFTKNNKAKPRVRGTLAASPTVSASYQPASGIIDAAPAPIRTSHSRARSTASSTVEGRPRSVDRVSIFDEDGALAPEFAGRKLNKAYTSQSPRPILAKGLEGRLLVPDVLLKPSGSASGSLGDGSIPRANSMTSLRMTRSRSEASVPRASAGAGAGVKSALGSVKEEGVWHRPAEKDGDEAGSEASASASASGSGSSGVRKGRRGSGSSRSRSSKDPSRAGLKLHERGRLNMEGELVLSGVFFRRLY